MSNEKQLEDDAQFLNADNKPHHDDLPSPVQAQVSRTHSKPKLSTAIIIPIWIAISSSVIIYNNYIYNTLEFKFPVFLVTFHLTFAVCLHPALDAFCRITDPCRLLARAYCSARQTCSMVPRR
jgi:hypothetical protein